MSYHKLMTLINSSKAVDAQKNVELLHIVGNPRLLDSKKTAKDYDKLFKNYEKIFKANGVKHVVVTPDFNALLALKEKIKSERKRR